MKLDVKVDVFEGPLDLLLHLIEKNKVSIYDIPIALITDQYLEYLHALEEVYSMDSIGEFLVMASTLLKIKAHMLLPQEEEEEEDPREELVERLIEYKMYKYAAGELKDRSVDADKIFYKEESVPEEVKSYVEPVNTREIVGDVTLQKLNEVFCMVMKRKKDRQDPVRSRFGKIEREQYKVEDCMEQIRHQMKGMSHINFRTLLEIQPDRENIIVHFLAVLELMKEGEIMVTQKDNFAEIYLTHVEAL